MMTRVNECLSEELTVIGIHTTGWIKIMQHANVQEFCTTSAPLQSACSPLEIQDIPVSSRVHSG